jgi:hypothetical protein
MIEPRLPGSAKSEASPDDRTMATCLAKSDMPTTSTRLADNADLADGAFVR